jgi:hypothetical protein
VFERAADALAAFQQFNDVALDGKKLNIELVETAVPPGTIAKLSSGIKCATPRGGRGGWGGSGRRAKGAAASIHTPRSLTRRRLPAPPPPGSVSSVRAANGGGGGKPAPNRPRSFVRCAGAGGRGGDQLVRARDRWDALVAAGLSGARRTARRGCELTRPAARPPPSSRRQGPRRAQCRRNAGVGAAAPDGAARAGPRSALSPDLLPVPM